MLTSLGKVSVRTRGCSWFGNELDSSGRWRIYTDGMGHYAGIRVTAQYFLLPLCA
jgi:hypothetical protein